MHGHISTTAVESFHGEPFHEFLYAVGSTLHARKREASSYIPVPVQRVLSIHIVGGQMPTQPCKICLSEGKNMAEEAHPPSLANATISCFQAHKNYLFRAVCSCPDAFAPLAFA